MLGRMIEKTNKYYSDFRESQEGRNLSKRKASDNNSIVLPLLSKSPKVNKSVSIDPEGKFDQLNGGKIKIIPMRSKVSISLVESEQRYKKLGTEMHSLENGNAITSILSIKF